MSLGSEWEERLGASKIQDPKKPNPAEQESAERQRAEETILTLQQSLCEVRDHRYLVMKLEYRDVTGRFDSMYGKKFVSSDRFKGTAKIVVEYCLANDLDVYVWEEDFSMALREKIGAEIWVTPHAVPY